MRRTGRIFWLLAFGPKVFRTHLFPAFTVGFCGISVHSCGGSRVGCIQNASWRIAGDTPASTVPLQRLARGKSYPVTAAQLLRLRTGFLAPIHCFKLAKN